MTRALPAAAAAAALLLAAGCGSSASSTTSSTATAGASTLHAETTPKFGSPPSSAPVQSGSVQIAYRNIAINPDTVRVRVGTTVRWLNDDAVQHNVTSDGGPQHFASADFGLGATSSVKLTHPGVVHYLCTIHPASMNGTIEVLK